MALKPCRECKAMVSESATTCPHCGIAEPIEKPFYNKRVGCIGFVVGFVVLAVIIVGSGKQNKSYMPLQDNDKTQSQVTPPPVHCSLIDGYQIGMTIESFKESYAKNFPTPTCNLSLPSIGEQGGVSCDGYMVINNIPADVTFHFGEGKLFSIAGNFDPASFHTIKQAFIERFG